jgi:hypothetical protein
MTTDTGFLPYDVEQRRGFLMVLAEDGDALKSLAETVGEDILPYVIQAMAVELAKTSIVWGASVETRP